MPQNPFIIATKAPDQNVYVFDITKHPSEPEEGKFNPQHTCVGHTDEGYGISWSSHTQGRLASGSNDGKVCIWDVMGGEATISPLLTWTDHTSVVEDIEWSPHSPHILGSVGDDKNFILWDVR